MQAREHECNVLTAPCYLRATYARIRGLCTSLTLGVHAQRGLQYLVCVFVCMSVDAYSCTTGYEAAYELYKRVQIYEGLNIKKAILLKRLRSGDMA